MGSQGDANEIRNLGYIAWKNNLSSLESQHGARWNSLIKKENTRFEDALKNIKVPKLSKASSDGIHWKGYKITSEPFSPEQTWSKGSLKCKCWDADVSDTMFVAAVQDPKGFERFSVEVYNLKHLKTLEHTGPTVAIFDSIVWFLGSEKDLRYNTVKSWSPTSGIKTHYKTDNLKDNLELKRGEDGSVYVVRTDFVETKFCLIPSFDTWLERPHLQSCIVSDNLTLPGIEKSDIIEALSFKAEWLVTRSRGIRTIWNMHNKLKPVTHVWGDVSYDSRMPFTLNVSDIRYDSYEIHLPKWVLTNPKPHQYPCSYHEHPLPAFVVHPKDFEKAKGLLIIAYGAYGTPTRVGSLISRWKSLLDKNWIICSVMVPGSGDHDEEWVRAGQRLNRIESINAFKESIEALKEEYGFDKTRVALYGRSAGGLLASSVCINNPELVGALYIESPYVDVLRTITNPKLPLTTLETKEFGSIESSTNVIATASWSPMEHIPVGGIPELFVIARTDTTDLEVFPYEVLKFIKRLRGKSNGRDKLLFIHKGRGHFTTSWETRAEDIALLDNWIEQPPGLHGTSEKSALRTKNHIPKYNSMAPSRKNRNRATRKNRDRKNRSNMPVPMMGGKRRGSRKHGRKGRKGSRKH
jgi:hypothetical protein